VPHLTDPWQLGPLTIPEPRRARAPGRNRNWFVRLQAKRYGAGFAVSEMVSSFAIHYGNQKTLTELLVIHPEEKAAGPGGHPALRPRPGRHAQRGGHGGASRRRRDRHQHGLPVPKVMKTGAGAAMLADPATAVKVARAAAEGSGLPVTVKLRASRKPGERDGVELARRLVEEAGVAGLSFHPRSAAVRHKGTPDYDLAAELVAELPVPVIISGGLHDAEHVHWVFEHTGAAAIMLARGALGNPWLFAQVLGTRASEPTSDEILDEWEWVLDRGAEHLGGRPGGALPAQVPPVVRRAARRDPRHPGCPSAGGHARRAAADPARPQRAAARVGTRCYPHRPLPPPCGSFSSHNASRRTPEDMQKDVILTPEGLEKLKSEIEHLSTEKRREVAQRIKEAREFGDISENSEYDDAKNEQAMLESRIATLEDKLRSASVINQSELDSDVVRVGSVVTVSDAKRGSSQTYGIVGSTEADPSANKLSNESPVGKALLGHKRGDTVTVSLPNGSVRELKVDKIDVG
jgi:transcription elongation factor GreA